MYRYLEIREDLAFRRKNRLELSDCRIDKWVDIQ